MDQWCHGFASMPRTGFHASWGWIFFEVKCRISLHDEARTSHHRAFASAIMPRSTKHSKVLTQVIGFVCCLVLPVFATAIAPATWITLDRTGAPPGEVNVTARTCTVFFISYRTQRVENLVEVDSDVRRGERIKRRHGDRNYNNTQREEDEGTLVLRGRETEARISVSPASLNRAAEAIRAFQAAESPPRRRLFVMANWKFGLGMGVPLSLLALLYVTGVVWAGVRWLRSRFAP